MSLQILPLRCFICATLAVALSGCTSLQTEQFREAAGFKSKEQKLEEKYGEPIRMAAVWTPDILTTPGAPPTRGFGGRLFFYNKKNQAVPVQGDLMVYGYDDTDPTQPKRRADKRFGFNSEKFASHFSESEFGASYSVWVPWDYELDHRKIVTLIPVFVTKSGQRIQGAPGKAVLPGRRDENEVITRPGEKMQQKGNVIEFGPAVQPVQYTEADAATRLKTTTIPLSGSMKQRMVAQRNLNAQRPHQPTIQAPTPQSQQLAAELGRRMLQQQQIQTMPALPQQQALLNALNSTAAASAQDTVGGPDENFHLQNHFGRQPYAASSAPFAADQFNQIPPGSSFQPPLHRRTPTPHVPRFERHQYQAPTSPDARPNPALVR